MRLNLLQRMGIYLYNTDPGAAGGAGGGAGAAAGAAGGGAGGATPPWYQSLPAEYHTNPLINTLKSSEDLAKGYVNAQQLIGAKRFAIPGKDAKPEAWNETWDALGRPKTPGDYSAGKVALKEGINVDKATIDQAKTVFHGAGLTDAQQTAVMDFYFNGMNTTHEAMVKSNETARAAADQALRQEWGNKYDANLDIARSALRHFGDAEAMKDIEAGLGNNPGLIKMFHKIGTVVMEDSSRRGGGNPMGVGGAAEAITKIAELKRDKEYQNALNTKNHPGHNDAVALWLDLHGRAYPKGSGEE